MWWSEFKCACVSVPCRITWHHMASCSMLYHFRAPSYYQYPICPWPSYIPLHTPFDLMYGSCSAHDLLLTPSILPSFRPSVLFSLLPPSLPPNISRCSRSCRCCRCCRCCRRDDQQVRTICSLALAALAESAHPYGIESFDGVLRPLWKGIRQHRGKGLAAFLKAIGFIIPLMDAEHANYYTREVMVILVREFQSPDEEMKKIVLKVVQQCVGTEGVEAQYVREEILPEFFRNFCVRRMALDRRNHRSLVETTVEIGEKVGAIDILRRVVDDLKDESEPYRVMVMECVEKVVQNQGASEIDSELENRARHRPSSPLATIHRSLLNTGATLTAVTAC